jgi:hypothetical protein
MSQLWNVLGIQWMGKIKNKIEGQGKKGWIVTFEGFLFVTLFVCWFVFNSITMKVDNCKHSTA